jgi:hypothetical protein
MQVLAPGSVWGGWGGGGNLQVDMSAHDHSGIAHQIRASVISSGRDRSNKKEPHQWPFTLGRLLKTRRIPPKTT